MTIRILALAGVVLALCGSRASAQTAPAPADTSAHVSSTDSIHADSAMAAPADTVFACERLKPVPRPLNVAEFGHALERAYPAEERAAGHEGSVTVRLVVGRDGYVESVEALRSTGAWSFRAAAVQAAPIVRFTPPKRDGVPVRCWADVPMSFHISR